jgi:hypothetical protein
VDRLVAWYRVTSSVGAVVALIAANAVPLIGVVLLGWNVWTILIVYWLENGIVGAFNVAKMLRAEGPAGQPSNWRINGRPADQLAQASLVPFFVVHYGIFWLVHGFFVLTLPLFGGFGGDVDLAGGVDPAAVILAAVVLGISHGVSFWFNFLRGGEYRRVSAAAQMFAPYGRLVILHVTIILGGIAIAFTGAPAAAIAILVALKTVLDIGFHLAEHRRAASVPTTDAAPGTT